MSTCIKKYVLPALVFISVLLPGLSHAAHHILGFVDVITDSNGVAVEMRGTMSVRYNGTLLNAWMGASGTVNGPITFSGMNEEGVMFSCSVSPTHRLYPIAVGIRNSLTNGGFLLAKRYSDLDSCAELTFTNSSTFLD